MTSQPTPNNVQLMYVLLPNHPPFCRSFSINAAKLYAHVPSGHALTPVLAPGNATLTLSFP